MRYGWLREHGCYISSCHMEAAARILVARRCKQAGMHWRHHNAACVCAICLAVLALFSSDGDYVNVIRSRRSKLLR